MPLGTRVVQTSCDDCGCVANHVVIKEYPRSYVLQCTKCESSFAYDKAQPKRVHVNGTNPFTQEKKDGNLS